MEEIKNLIISTLGENIIISANANALQPYLEISPEKIGAVGQILFDNGFDHLACITGIDNGEGIGTIEIVYNFYAIIKNISLTIKLKVNRNKPHEPIPSVPTLSHIWRGADWLERETYEMIGVHFEGHQDLRRLLLPADWEGFPLRKDYQEQELYHGINVKY
jgi:NADH-quinone oxidoreductase subunit C